MNEHGQRRAVQRINLLAPVVAQRMLKQGVLITDEFFIEQTAAVKGMLTQHALTPGIDRKYGSLIHAFGRRHQAVSSPLSGFAFRVCGNQSVQIRVFFQGRSAPEAAGGFNQPFTNPVRQLFGRRSGKGHHQNFRRHQWPVKAGVLSIFLPVTKNQSQIQGGYRPGFAGAGTGLDQP